MQAGSTIFAILFRIRSYYEMTRDICTRTHKARETTNDTKRDSEKETQGDKTGGAKKHNDRLDFDIKKRRTKDEFQQTILHIHHPRPTTHRKEKGKTFFVRVI
jgi:hypothetical protein